MNIFSSSTTTQKDVMEKMRVKMKTMDTNSTTNTNTSTGEGREDEDGKDQKEQKEQGRNSRKRKKEGTEDLVYDGKLLMKKILRQILAAASNLHERGIIHR